MRAFVKNTFLEFRHVQPDEETEHQFPNQQASQSTSDPVELVFKSFLRASWSRQISDSTVERTGRFLHLWHQSDESIVDSDSNQNVQGPSKEQLIHGQQFDVQRTVDSIQDLPFGRLTSCTGTVSSFSLYDENASSLMDGMHDFSRSVTTSSESNSRKTTRSTTATQDNGLCLATERRSLNGATTVMLQNVPDCYTQRQLMSEVSQQFQGKFDYFYLPLDIRSKQNRGFAFINFTSPRAAQAFYKAYHQRLPALCQAGAQIPFTVKAAELQGFEANYEHYVAMKAKPRKRTSKIEPFFLRSKSRISLASGAFHDARLPVSQSAPVQLRCESCSFESNSNFVFCPFCGLSLI